MTGEANIYQEPSVNCALKLLFIHQKYSTTGPRCLADIAFLSCLGCSEF